MYNYTSSKAATCQRKIHWHWRVDWLVVVDSFASTQLYPAKPSCEQSQWTKVQTCWICFSMKHVKWKSTWYKHQTKLIYRWLDCNLLNSLPGNPGCRTPVANGPTLPISAPHFEEGNMPLPITSNLGQRPGSRQRGASFFGLPPRELKLT